MLEHTAIYISNKDDKKALIKRITSGFIFPELASQKGAIFSEKTVNSFIEEETRHENYQVSTQTQNRQQV